ncbi:MAG TPA: pitrilysin family protein [Pyrinomonadaceae bacterium]|nr:pitrilysin family protein [Pyrinomonadaceae bacterium]
MKVVSRQLSVVGKFVLLTLVFLTFSSAGFAQTAKPGISEQAALVTEFDVNGLKVIVKRRVNSPTVAAGLFVRGGARNITDKNAGIEGFTLQVASAGSKNFPRETLRRELARTGSSIGAGATNDYSVLSLASTRQNFDRSWDIFTDIALNPTFAPENIEQARQIITTGLREQETDNDNYLQVLQDRIIYAGHPYANPVRGTLETISRFSAKDLSEYHRKTMQTSRLLLVVVGDIDPKELQTRIAATLGKLPRGDYKEQPYPALDFSKPTLDVTSRALPTNYVQGVFNAPSINSPDYSAMRVAVAILQSRIFNEVRTKRQLSYAPNAELDSYAANTGNIYVTAVDANQAVGVMLDEVNNLKNLKAETYPPQLISSIAGHFLTMYYLGQETNGAQAAELAKYELVGGNWRGAFQFLDKIRDVTPQDIQAVSNKYLKNIRFVVVGNPQAVNREIFLRN